MDPSLARVEDLFHRALELPREQRADYVWRNCGDNTHVFEQVQRLLSAEEKDEYLRLSGETPATPEWRTGQRFGHYRIVRLLGRGGMGAVYLAERDDGEFEQKVALKLLAPHLVEDSFAERFRGERQVLASLNHPNIVHLLDGGVSEKGEPYLATEYIEGAALDQYANERKLNVRERLKLLQQICAAVDHAHQNLIVHRDLKPSNILVTSDGVAKLLDFGTAKLLSGVGEKTATEAMLLTPKYASPEQLRNEPITTRSDVYSLGLILYELLSGGRPFATTGEAIGELARAYQFTEATALGKTVTPEAAEQRRTSVKELQRELSGDLRAIATKALEHQAKDRYGSAAELARDLTAYLEAKPVSARSASPWYVLSKFVYRQRVAVGAAVLLLVAVGAGVWTTFKEKRRAERRFEQVRQLARYQLFDLYDQADKVLGATKLKARLAEEALRYLDGLAQEAQGDRALQIELAEGYLRVGDVLGNYTKENLGQSERAAAAYRKGMELVRGLEGEDARKLQTRFEFTMALSDYATGSDRKGALPRLEKAVRDYEALQARQPKSADNYLQLGLAYLGVARARQAPDVSNEIGDFSEKWVLQAREALEKGLTLEPDNAALLGAMHMLCSVRAIWVAGVRPQEALRWAGEGEMWSLRLKGERNSPNFLVAEANRYTGRGAALRELGQMEEALPQMAKAIEILDRIASDPENRTAPINLTLALLNRANIEYDLKRMDDYLATCERAYRLMEAEKARGPMHATLRANYHRVLYFLAWAYVERKDAKAPEFMDRTYQTLTEAARQDPNDQQVRAHLCDMLLNLNAPGYDRPEEAAQLAREMVALRPNSVSSYDGLARALERLGDNAGAVATLRKALEILGPLKEGQGISSVRKNLEARIAKLEGTAPAQP